MAAAVWQSWIVDLFHGWMLRKIGGDQRRAGGLPFDPQGQGLEASFQQVAGHGVETAPR